MFSGLEYMPMFTRGAVIARHYAGVDIDDLRIESDVFRIGGCSADAAGINAVGLGSVVISGDELERTMFFVQIKVDGKVRDDVRIHLLQRRSYLLIRTYKKFPIDKIRNDNGKQRRLIIE